MMQVVYGPMMQAVHDPVLTAFFGACVGGILTVIAVLVDRSAELRNDERIWQEHFAEKVEGEPK